jgi:hypothetical protein
MLTYWQLRSERTRTAFSQVKMQAVHAHPASQAMYVPQLEHLKATYEMEKERLDAIASLIASHPEEQQRLAAEAQRQRQRDEEQRLITEQNNANVARIAGISID